MSPLLYRLGRGAARHRRLVVAAWFVAVLALAFVGKAAGGQFHDTVNVPGVESQQAANLLKRTFPAQAGGGAQIVFHPHTGTLTDPANAAAITESIDAVRRLPHVVGATNPLATKAISQNGSIGLGTARYDQSSISLPKDTFSRLEAATAPATKAGLQVEFGGEIPSAAARPSFGSSEGLGVLAAMFILLVAFGSVIAMGLPIATALFGLGFGLTTITFLSAFIDMPSTSTAIASMVGLGVGIDYALFIITRHRVGLHRGLTVEDAIGRSIATAGQAVLIAGTTVVIAICGLAVAGIPLVTFMGIGAAIVVAVMVVASLTLLPALMGFAGHNIDRFGLPGTTPKVEAGTVDEHGHYHGWARWAHHVSRHPVVYLLGSLALVLVLAMPARHMRLGLTDASQDPPSSTLRQSYDLLATGFGPGFNGPLILAVDLTAPNAEAALPRLVSAVKADPDVVRVAPPTLSPTGDTAVVQVTPRSSPQDVHTTDLVNRLRADVIPPAVAGTGLRAYVGGQTATYIDLSGRVSQRLPLFIGCVVGLSFVLLMLVFRSILVPLKAAVMNILSIAAAYGVIVAVFQNGWGASLFGVHQSLPIVSFIPMFMFAILFGLSMDYEVFLLSRIREEYLLSGDNTESVVTGITTTARVITSAALIMISVFLSFVLGDNATVKMMGLGLATAVFVDATLIRLVLVPATMRLLGDANWWIPKWLDRMLPNLDIEGETRLPAEELEQPQVTSGDDAQRVPAPV
jgi:RND superfamily putative drug exporter